MKELTPIFPLQIVVFPGDSLNLHIFEPRYKELVNECYEDNQIFGIPTFFKNTKLTYGTTIKIDKIEKRYPDGKMDIRTTGIDVFRIIKLFKNIPGKLYSKANVNYIVQQDNGLEELNNEILLYLKELYDIMSIKRTPVDPDDPYFCFKTCHYIGMSLQQKFELLRILNEHSRQLYIIGYLKDLIPSVRRIESIKVKAKMNGHFKHLQPPDF